MGNEFEIIKDVAGVAIDIAGGVIKSVVVGKHIEKNISNDTGVDLNAVNKNQLSKDLPPPQQHYGMTDTQPISGYHTEYVAPKGAIDIENIEQNGYRIELPVKDPETTPNEIMQEMNENIKDIGSTIAEADTKRRENEEEHETSTAVENEPTNGYSPPDLEISTTESVEMEMPADTSTSDSDSVPDAEE